ncbi:mechanosensitive ion channel family protein [Luminiphilus sp. nBUS_16]|uniref:mechanosensitive ion channel family protein n=1 Tax=Luminiphilus sp. nBUS_16 TaxID=3395315 RepID=UPI003EB89FF0
MMKFFYQWLVFGVLLTGVANAHAQSAKNEVTNQQGSALAVYQSEQKLEELSKETNERKLSPAAARTPLDAMLGFRKYLRAGNFDVAAQYLDLRYVPDEIAAIEPQRLAQALAFVWTKQNVLDISVLSDSVEGHLDDGLPSYRDQVGEVQLSETVVPVFLQRIPDSQGESVWRISNATVVRIPDMWEEHGYSDWAIWLAKTLPTFTLLGMTNWQTFSMFIALGLLWVISGLITRLMSWLSLRIPNKFPLAIQHFWALPMRIIIYVALLRIAMEQLGLSITARVYLKSSPLEYLAATVFIVALLTLWRDYKFRQLESSGDLYLTALLRPLILMVKIIIVVVAMLAWAKNAGFNISTLIAGLGVGSLAIALAAQRTMENIIGAVTIYAARPIRPGDLCRFGDLKGTVEEIGLRSVTVRTLDRTRVFIPNAKFAADQVENISVRDRIRFLKNLQIQMPTSEQLRVILGELREMLSAHPRVLPDTISVRLVDIEAATAVFRVDAGIMTTDYQTFLAIAEDLNLRIIETVHENGAIFSGPGQVLQVRDFHKASEETMSEVAAKLDGWRDSQQLPFPDVSEDRKAEIEGSLIYPPAGSPDR